MGLTRRTTGAGFALAVLLGGCAPSVAVSRPHAHLTEVAVAPRKPSAEPTRTTPSYEYFFDRNALIASTIVGESVVALTLSGHVLRFDKASLALTAEQFFSRRARALGGTDGDGVLVGFEGGRIARLDVASFSVETITTVSGRPLWVGRAHAGERRDAPLVVYAKMKETGPRELEEYAEFGLWSGATGRDLVVELPLERPRYDHGDAFLLDSADRLWVGVDSGEWGGAVSAIDVETGAARAMPRNEWGGGDVYGFAESGRGEVLAFGGSTHLGLYESFVARLSPGPVTRPYHFEGSPPFDSARRRRWEAATGPRAPVTQLLERADGKFWLVAQRRLYEADVRFQHFRRLPDLAPRELDVPEWLNPGVASAMLDGERLLLATRGVGFVEYARERTTTHTFPDQIDEAAFASISTPAGLAFLRHSGASLYTRSGHWKSFYFDFSGPDDHPLSEPEVPITDPDVLSARAGIEDWLLRLRSQPRMAGDRRSRIEWDAQRDLVATVHGLSLETRGSTTREALSIAGVDGTVTSFARDGSGRLWLAGTGLWVVKTNGAAVAMHPQLPFLVDAVADDISFVDGKLILSLGDRGAAIVDPATLASPARER